MFSCIICFSYVHIIDPIFKCYIFNLYTGIKELKLKREGKKEQGAKYYKALATVSEVVSELAIEINTTEKYQTHKLINILITK